ncbi:MAG: MATE family efflux transporter, partial [Limisphaerales bacterium]
MAAGIFIITWFISFFSKEGVAAYGIATRIEQILLLPTIGLNVAVLTLVGQNYGARQLERIYEVRQTALRWGLASADVSTGEVQVMQREDSSALHQQLAQQEASE